MAWRTAKRRPPGGNVDVRWGHRGPRLPGTRGEGQGERQRDGVAEVNRRALWQSAQAVGGVVCRWEHRLWPPVGRLQKRWKTEAEESVRRETVCFVSETVTLSSSSSSAVLPDAVRYVQIKRSHLHAHYSPTPLQVTYEKERPTLCHKHPAWPHSKVDIAKEPTNTPYETDQTLYIYNIKSLPSICGPGQMWTAQKHTM